MIDKATAAATEALTVTVKGTSIATSAIIVGAALLVLVAVHRLLAPPLPLLALSVSSTERTDTTRTAIPSFLLPLSPALLVEWWRLAWRQRVPPWRLASRVVEASQLDWHRKDGVPVVPEGTPVVAWQRVGVWSEERLQEDCLPLTALRKWERIADPLADEALRVLRGVGGAEASTTTEESKTADSKTPESSPSSPSTPPSSSPALLSALLSPPNAETASDPILTLYRSQITRRPPRGAGVIPLEWYEARDRRRRQRDGETASSSSSSWLQRELSCRYDDLIPDDECGCSSDAAASSFARLRAEHAREDAEWNALTPEEQQEELEEERRLIRLGQDFFYRYSGGILLSLLHFSLAGGFASPRLSGVLKRTGYLVPAGKESKESKTMKPSSTSTSNPKSSTTTSSPSSSPSSRSGDRTWKRLMETTQWVLDVMERGDALADSASPRSDFGGDDLEWPAGGAPDERLGGVGRVSTARVRFLHSQVRAMLAGKAGGGGNGSGGVMGDQEAASGNAASSSADAPADDALASSSSASSSDRMASSSASVNAAGSAPSSAASAAEEGAPASSGASPSPLNQTDLLSTLLSFSAAPLASLSRMGLDSTITATERSAYLGIWRYAGWLMGVDARLVRRCLRTPQSADRALWSCVLNLFTEKDLRDAATRPPTYKILESIADRPPFHRSFALHAAFTTSLVGTQLSDALGLPRPSIASQLQVYITYLGMFVTVTFGRLWRKGWDRKRVRATRKLLRRLIVFNLDFKRSAFAGGRGSSAGMVAVERDHDAAMRDVREYQWMMREMVGGVAAVAVVAVVVVAVLYQTL